MERVQVDFLDKDLWRKFFDVTNEMIVTKSGRRMFPVVKIKINGLNPNAFYEVKLEFVQVGTYRWKYMNGGWVSGGKAETAPCQRFYKNPESPNTGQVWMKAEGIGFSKVKLTNKPNPAEGQVVLNSLHKYMPVVHITKLGSNSEPCGTFKISFPEAEFIAVTAYQNEEVTQLKIKHNPFAKAFQETRDRPLDIFTHNNWSNLTSVNSCNMLGGSPTNGTASINGQTINKCSQNASHNSNSSDSNSSNNQGNGSNSVNLLSSNNFTNLCNLNQNNPYQSQGYINGNNHCSNVYGTENSMTTAVLSAAAVSMPGYYSNNYNDLTSSYHHIHSNNSIISMGSCNYGLTNSVNNSTGTNSPINNTITNISNNTCTTPNLVTSSGSPSTNDHITDNLNNNSTENLISSSSPTDLSSNSANLSSSSSSSSSLSSSSSYCERYTPLRSHRSIPYSNIRSSVAVGNTYNYHEHYYNPWAQQASDGINWTLTPDGYYS